jgi:hypothetical protein
LAASAHVEAVRDTSPGWRNGRRRGLKITTRINRINKLSAAAVTALYAASGIPWRTTLAGRSIEGVDDAK